MPDYKIDLETAKTWTKAWRDNHSGMVTAFRIDSAEINEILAVEGAVYIRAYLGYDVITKVEKLVLVPVDLGGRDIIPTDANANKYAYDFTLPCPSTCDLNSELNS